MSFNVKRQLLGAAGAGGVSLSTGATATTLYGNRGQWGTSVAMSEDGSTIAIGAYSEPNGYNYGRVYVYTRSGDTWSLQATITPNSSVNARNGNSLSLSGDGNTLLIAKAYDNNETGLVRIYTRSGSSWSQATTISASNPSSGDYFGASVSINKDGNTIAVASPLEDTTASNSGAVYIFTGSGSSWSQQALLKANSIASENRLGGFYSGFDRAVELSSDGNTLIAGEMNNASGGGSGDALIYTRSGSSWSYQTTLNASDQAAGDKFAHTVSISGDGNTAAVGASEENNGDGAVYIFTRSGSSWSQQAKISQGNNGKFGRHVDLTEDGNAIVIGEDVYNNGDGRIYLYSRSGSSWSEEWNRNVGSGVQFGDNPYFGEYCEISDDGTVVMGCTQHYDVDFPGQNRGIARIYI